MKKKDPAMEALKEQLLIEISRRNTDYVAHLISDDAELFGELMNLVFHGKAPLPHRASWVVSTVTDKYPELLSPHIEAIIHHLPRFGHPGICRCLLRQLAAADIPADLQGELYDTCYQWLLSRFQPPAVKVHCMQILFNIAQQEPDLLPELQLLLEPLADHESAAIKSRCRHLLRKLTRQSSLPE